MAQISRENYCARSDSYSIAMEQMFIQIPQNVERSLTSKVKKPKTDNRYWWWMVFKKMCQGTTTIEENETN